MGVQTLFHLHTYMLAPSTLVLFHHQVSGVRYRNNILHHVAMFHCHHHSGKEGLEDLVSAEESKTKVGSITISCIGTYCLVNIQAFRP